MSSVVSLNERRGGVPLRIGMLRLTDSAPAILAHEFGFFADEGVEAQLLIEPSWANIADKLTYGVLDAAVIVPPLAFAVELGLRGAAQAMIIPAALSLGGNTITLSPDLAGSLRDMAAEKNFSLPHALAALLARRHDPLVLGIVHAYSTHNLLLRYWLATAGLIAGRDVKLTVVPPVRAVEALSAGEIAGFCAGAPWGEIAARKGAGVTIAASDDIWRNAPEKAFAVRARWAADNPEALKGALRALARAAQFCDAPENASYTGALLSRQRCLDVDSHAILSSLPGGAIAQGNLSRFWRNAAMFPWISHGHWFLGQMARWELTGAADIAALAARVYRPDLYRGALAGMGLNLPTTDLKAEGAHAGPWRLEGSLGPLAMDADNFCDGAVFAACEPVF